MYTASLELDDGQTAHINILGDNAFSPFSFVEIKVTATEVQPPTIGTPAPCSGAGCNTSNVMTSTTSVAVQNTSLTNMTNMTTPDTGSSNTSNTTNTTGRRLLWLANQNDYSRTLAIDATDRHWPFYFEGTGWGLTEPRKKWEEEKGLRTFHMRRGGLSIDEKAEDKGGRVGFDAEEGGGEERRVGVGRRAAEDVQWYVQAGGAAVPSEDQPHFLFEQEGASTIYVIEPASQQYVVSLTAGGAAHEVQVHARSGTAEQLQGGVTTVTVPGKGRVFAVHSPQSDGISFLKLRVMAEQQARCRIWVGVNGLATERSWLKWVEGTDEELNAIPDMWFTSVQINSKWDTERATWTIQSDKEAVWELDARTVSPVEIEIEELTEFRINPDAPAALFLYSEASSGSGRLFFQLMPSQASEEVFQNWETLRDAVKLIAVTRVLGEETYYQLSDWGYTTDGVAGLQVMVDDWDREAEVFLHVYLKAEAPSGAFSVVVYKQTDLFEAWKWWLGGIVFAPFIFCIARCFCRGRLQQQRIGPMDPAALAGMRHMINPVTVEEFASEPPPEKMKHIHDTLFQRLDVGASIYACVPGHLSVEAACVWGGC